MADNNRLELHNDEPTLIDQLHRAEQIREVAEAVANCEPPQVFGVHGDWGLGKTSFLQQVQMYLTGKCAQQDDAKAKAARNIRTIRSGVHKDQVLTVWFEAWRYQNEEAPVVAMLHEMRSQLEWGGRIWNRAKQVAEVSVRGALLTFEDVTKQIGFQASKIEKASQDWERKNLATTLPSHTLRQLLEATINQLLGNTDGDKRRLVVFVDDLDRCEPEAARKLLASLKIYLNLRNCVFVLGMNQKVIEKSLDMGDAQEYLEKLCQNIWHLPAVHDPNTQFCRWLNNPRLYKLVRSALGLDRNLPPNPRRLKGLANLVLRLADKLLEKIPNDDSAAEEHLHETQIMLLVAYVYQFHHNLFRHWETSNALYGELYQWASTGDTTIEFLKELSLPWNAAPDPSKPTTGEFIITDAFPDPTSIKVFWMQKLVLELGDGVKPDEFRHYFHETR